MFTVKEIDNLKPAAERYERYSKGERGFGIRVSPSGMKMFITRYRRKPTDPDKQGQLVKINLGQYHSEDFTLSDAREAHQGYRRLLKQGIDPKEYEEIQAQEKLRQLRAEQEADTVQGLFDEFMEREVEKNRKRPEYARSAIEKNVLPYWKDLKVKDITRRDVVKLLDKITDRGAPVMANRVKSLVTQMFKFAISRGVIDSTPCAYLKPPGGREKPRIRNLDDDEIRAFWYGLDKTDMGEPTKQALKILLATGQRRGEIAAAEWSEVDLKACTWTIPGDKAKNEVTHLVPLSPLACDLFKKLHKLTKYSRHVLPSPRDEEKQLTPLAITRAVKRHLDIFKINAFTPHDLRRTVTTQMRSKHLKIGSDIVDKILNHKEQGIIKHYDQYDYFEEKKEALDAWGKRLQMLINMGDPDD